MSNMSFEDMEIERLEERLKPCPFCGDESPTIGKEYGSIHCGGMSCSFISGDLTGHKGNIDKLSDKEKRKIMRDVAIKRWNSRKAHKSLYPEIPKAPIKRFMRVDFGDNDFGWSVQSAMEKIWNWVHGNNAHCLVPKGKKIKHFRSGTVTDIFMELKRTGVLDIMMRRTFSLEHKHNVVEFWTRGLYWGDDKRRKEELKEIKEDKNSLELGECDNYLHFRFSFHYTNDFRKKWSNGESLYIDLETGKTELF